MSAETGGLDHGEEAQVAIVITPEILQRLIARVTRDASECGPGCLGVNCDYQCLLEALKQLDQRMRQERAAVAR